LTRSEFECKVSLIVRRGRARHIARSKVLFGNEVQTKTSGE
jgi:hypothetical protein